MDPTINIEHFEIATRFRGPPRSGNGGYTCGRIARHLPGPVTVRLKAPPPLGAGLRLESGDRQARLYCGTTLIGEGASAPLDLAAPPCPGPAAAEAATRSFAGFTSHLFPGCFVCGTERAAGDGLRIFPGPVDAAGTLAAPWTPDASLADEAGAIHPEFLWSALDCAGAYAIFPLPEGSAVVLGELAADIRGPLQAGDRCVVTGWPLGISGRKRVAGTAIYASGGRLAAIGRAVWIEVPLDTWN